jgi:hypothetical protein
VSNERQGFERPNRWGHDAPPLLDRSVYRMSDVTTEYREHVCFRPIADINRVS